MYSHAQAPTFPQAPQAAQKLTTPPAIGAWQLDLLGRVQLRHGHITVTRWPSRAVAALLARLALAPGRDHPREELIELLWPGVALDKGRQRLRQALSLLRRVLEHGPGTLPPLLQADRLLIRLTPQAMSCDVLQFQQHLACGEPAMARALYAGELMPGYYDDWIVAERHRLESLREGLDLPPLAPVRSPEGKPPAADPMPAPETAVTSAHDGWRRPALPTLPALPALPAYWTRAFGLAGASARLQQAVCSHRLVTVLGPGGHGKTRLAVAAAGALAASAPAGFTQVGFVSLADAQSLPALWLTLAQALAPDTAGDPARQVPARIGSQALLLVLDILEQLDDAASQAISALLQVCPHLHLLLTSRRRVGLAGEQLFEMPSLPVPSAEAAAGTAARPGTAAMPQAMPPVSLDSPATRPISENPAVALFVDRARQSRPEFHITQHNALAVVGLVRLLGGMPLAIELAASRLRALQPGELLQRLRDDEGSPLLDLLARPAMAASADARHASMRHVVAWSWRQLSAEAAALLRGIPERSTPSAGFERTGLARPGFAGALPAGLPGPAARRKQPRGWARRPGFAQRARCCQPGTGTVGGLLDRPGARRVHCSGAAPSERGPRPGTTRRRPARIGADPAPAGRTGGLPPCRPNRRAAAV